MKTVITFRETFAETALVCIYSQAGAPVNARSEAPFSQTPLDVAQLYGLDAPHPVGRLEILFFLSWKMYYVFSACTSVAVHQISPGKSHHESGSLLQFCVCVCVCVCALYTCWNMCLCVCASMCGRACVYRATIGLTPCMDANIWQSASNCGRNTHKKHMARRSQENACSPGWLCVMLCDQTTSNAKPWVCAWMYVHSECIAHTLHILTSVWFVRTCTGAPTSDQKRNHTYMQIYIYIYIYIYIHQRRNHT